MARANRYYIPQCVWHITHRCHKKEYLLKFARDKKRWIYWLYEAKKRYGLRILNYVVTSNHVHLLVLDTAEGVISKSLQLIAGRTGQEFNLRKNRKGAFWEDRYHATAVDTDAHLIRCLIYMDLNMVRAGVVKDPSEWPYGGYQEIQRPPERYGRIDADALMQLCGFPNREMLSTAHREWVQEGLKSHSGVREPQWTEAVAVGNRKFVDSMKDRLGYRAQGRSILKRTGGFELREPKASYNGLLGGENSRLSLLNTYDLEI